MPIYVVAAADSAQFEAEGTYQPAELVKIHIAKLSRGDPIPKSRLAR